MMKKILKFLPVLILPFLFVSPAYAMDEPDEILLDNITVYRNLIEPGDFLAIVPYYIPFTTTPDDPINETFIFRMLDTSNVEIGSKLAYPYNNLGYGSGIVSFYFESGTIWEEPYVFRVEGNPTHYPNGIYEDFSIGLANYSTAADHQLALRAKVIDLSQTLSAEYSQDLLTTSEGVSYLSTYGESYFLYAIPALSTMCPSMFYAQVRSPSYTSRSWEYTFANTLATRYDGTVINSFMTGSSGLFSVNTPAFMNIVSVFAFIILILVALWKFKATTQSAIIDGYALLILMMLNGFFSMIICGFIAFAGLTMGGVVWFLHRS